MNSLPGSVCFTCTGTRVSVAAPVK
jgi:hypothetical protein